MLMLHSCISFALTGVVSTVVESFNNNGNWIYQAFLFSPAVKLEVLSLVIVQYGVLFVCLRVLSRRRCQNDSVHSSCHKPYMGRMLSFFSLFVRTVPLFMLW